jgi:hypothetical protein
MTATHRYTHPYSIPLGAHHMDDPQSQLAEMREVDMHDGTEVERIGTTDDENEMVLVRWTDRSGIERITAVDPDKFDELFEEI